MPALAVEFQELSLRRKLCDSSVPLHIHSAIVAYVCNRQIPGSFLQAVIKNDLRRAVCLADCDNLPYLKDIVLFFYNYAPSTCYGSAEAMKNWVKG
jgi:hypothetical protein